MKKIKVLFLIGGFNTGGKERQLAELIKGLDRSVFEVFLMIRSPGAHYLDEIDKRLTTIFCLNQDRFGWSALYKITKVIAGVTPDIVHSWASITSFYAIWIKMLCRFKYVCVDGSIRQANPRSSQNFQEKLIRDFINQFSNLLISNSFAGHKAYRSDPSKAKVIYNGFNFNRILSVKSRESILNQYKVNGKFIVGMVARFDPQKDWTTFVKTAITMTTKDSEIAFFCVGDGPLLDEMKLMVPQSLQNRIIFTGRITEVEELVKTFDIAVLLSNNEIHGEGISNSITEYMSLARPVIANENGGNSELINSDKVGILIEKSDSELLEKHILELQNQPAIRSVLGINARERIVEHFSYDKMIDNYASLYKSLVSCQGF